MTLVGSRSRPWSTRMVRVSEWWLVGWLDVCLKLRYCCHDLNVQHDDVSGGGVVGGIFCVYCNFFLVI